MCYKQDSYISSTLDLVLKFKQKKQPNNFSYSPPPVTKASLAFPHVSH